MDGPSASGDEVEAWLRAGRIEPLIERAERATGIAARRFAIDLAARALLLADPGTIAAPLRARARALGIEDAIVATAAEQSPPHAVRVPLVDRERGEAYLRTFWVEFDPTGLAPERPELGPAAREAIAAALARAAEIAPPPRARDRFRLVAARPVALEHARIDGESIAAAALASAVSLWSERPIRAGIAITGRIAGGTIASVGEIAAKVRASIEAGCEAIVIPGESAAAAAAIRTVPVRTISELLDAALAAERTGGDPDRAVAQAAAAAAEGWRGYNWPSIAERLARIAGALPEGRPDLVVEVLAQLGAARRHLGDPEGSIAVIESAEAIADACSDAVPDAPLTRLARQRAMTALRLFRIRDARRSAKAALAIARRARLRGDAIKALGCLGLVELADDEAARAIAAFEEALALTLEHAPADAARSRVYLLEALGRAGRIDDARAHFDAAMREVEHGDARARRKKESWVRTGWGGVLAHAARWDDAIAVLDVPAVHESLHDDPLPGLLARRHLGLALARAGRPERGLPMLAASPLAHGRALEPGLRALAQVNVLVEGVARHALGRWDDDVSGRVVRALDALPALPEAERFFAPWPKRIRNAIARRATDGLGAALEALVARTEPLR